MSNGTAQGTVGPIIFADETARRQLRETGEVVTFRKDKRTTGATWWRRSRLGQKEGDVRVSEIEVIDPRDRSALEPYQSLSGFPSVEDWQRAIEELNGSLPCEGVLYWVLERE